MGGFGSGRSSTRSLVEHSLVIDLPLMMKRGWIKDGQRGRFGFRFVNSGERIRAYFDLRDPNDAWIELNYHEFIHADMQPEVVQHIRLTFTQPHFGGRRWWMICSCDGRRVAKLYRPQFGNTFACRKEWDLAYESQRQGGFDRAFARLGRLERQLERQERRRGRSVLRKATDRDANERVVDELQQTNSHCAAMGSTLRNVKGL